jgi:hypothetical protein
MSRHKAIVTDEENDPDNRFYASWFALIVGVIMLVVACGMGLSSEPDDGRPIRMRWYLAVLYSIGGKWAIAGPIGLLGLLSTYGGLRGVIAGYRKK